MQNQNESVPPAQTKQRQRMQSFAALSDSHVTSSTDVWESPAAADGQKKKTPCLSRSETLEVPALHTVDRMHYSRKNTDKSLLPDTPTRANTKHSPSSPGSPYPEPIEAINTNKYKIPIILLSPVPESMESQESVEIDSTNHSN